MRIVDVRDADLLGDDTIEDLLSGLAGCRLISMEEVERMKGKFSGFEGGDKRPEPVLRDHSQDLRRVPLVCRNCNATDTLKLYQSEPTPPAVSCWSCHAGVNMTVEQIYKTGRGMFPVMEKQPSEQQTH